MTDKDAFDEVEQKEEENPIESPFPNVTTQEISLYIKVLSGIGKNIKTKEDVENTPLVAFLAKVGNTSMDSEEFQRMLGNLKMMLVMANRTTALTQAYLNGVAIGYFLAKPESLPDDGAPLVEGSDSIQ